MPIRSPDDYSFVDPVLLSAHAVRHGRDCYRGHPTFECCRLIVEAEAGVPWDVYTSATISTDHRYLDGFDYTIDRYKDGSIRAIGLERPRSTTDADASQVGADAITQCTITTGSGYSNADNCQIDGVWGSVLLGAASVDYTIVDGLPDRITDTGYGYQKCYAPTTCSSPSLVSSDAVEDDGPAFARWQSDVSASWGSWNVWLQLNVGGDTAWQTNS